MSGAFEIAGLVLGLLFVCMAVGWWLGGIVVREPRSVERRSSEEASLAALRERFARDGLELDEFEQRVDAVLRGASWSSPQPPSRRRRYREPISTLPSRPTQIYERRAIPSNRTPVYKPEKPEWVRFAEDAALKRAAESPDP